jgi:mycothiol synthase
MALTWRPLALSDAPELTRLYAAAEAADHTGEHFSEDDLRQEMLSPTVDLADGTAGGWAGDRLATCAMVVRRDVADPVHRPNFSAVTDPQHRTDEVAAALTERIRPLAGAVHEKYFPGAPAELHSGAHENEHWFAGVLERAGFKRERTFVEMCADLKVVAPAPPVPEDLTLVAYEGQYDAQVLEARNATFAGHWGSTAISAETWQHEFRDSKDFRPDLSFLLLPRERDRVVAFVLSSFYAMEALATGVRELYVEYVGTREEARGRGLASLLLAHTLETARAAGFERSSLSVDVDNAHRALGVYERSGYVVADRAYGYVLPLG